MSAVATANELFAKRKTILNNGRAILDAAQNEKRELLASEREAYDKIWAESCALKDQAEKLVGDDNRRKQLDNAIADLDKSQGRMIAPTIPGAGPSYTHNNDGVSLTNPYEIRFRRRDNPEQTIQLAAGSAAWRRHQPDYRNALRTYLTTGQVGAALQTDISTAGGYMVLPEQFVTELLHDVDNIRWIRKLARIFTTTAQTLGVVKRTVRMASFAWGSELSTPAQDTALAYGKRTLTPHYMTGEILASRDLLRSALLPVDEYVRYEIGRDSGELEENAFQTGSGSEQPLGLFTATSDGIDTSRDVSTGNTTTAIGADNLRYAKYLLKPQYRDHPSTRWLFHRNTVRAVSLLKDGDGRYLWRDALTVGDPDTLLAYPVIESEFSPSTYTTGLYVGLLGAFYWYWICDSLEMDVMTLVEKYAETNQIAYVARRKTDGMPQLAEAFVRLKLA
jgi:HK97 family phage major capsid protein